MKRVFITGATGFLGSNLAKKLAGHGHQVTASGRNMTRGEDLKKQGIEFLAMDLCQKESFKDLQANYDWVFHSAALSSPWGSYQDFYKANFLATQNMLEHFKDNEKMERFVYVSSPSVYTDLKDKLNIREDSPLPKINLNHYIKTKKLCEIIVDQYVRDFNMPVITIRPQGIIGPGDPSIFPRLLRIAQKGILPKIGDGKTTLDLTYIDNVVHGLICAAQADSKYIGQKYNITNDEPIELYSTLEKIMAELGIKFKWKNLSQRKALFIGYALEKIFSLLPKKLEPPLTRYSVCTLAFNRTLDLSKAKEELNYRPIIPMQRALELCVQNMKKDLQGG